MTIVTLATLATLPIAGAQAQAPQGSNEAPGYATSWGQARGARVYPYAYAARRAPFAGAYAYEPFGPRLHHHRR